MIAVGTTSVRVLEQAALLSQDDGADALSPVSGWADLFILPGHRFRLVDGLITNFHLPRSTLLMLVSAFAGVEGTRTAVGGWCFRRIARQSSWATGCSASGIAC